MGLRWAILVLTIFAIRSTSAQVNPEEFVLEIFKELQQKFGQILPVLILHKIQETNLDEFGSVTIPHLQDSLVVLPNFEISIAQNSECGEQIYGTMKVCSANITGLETLDISFKLYIGPLAVQLFFDIEHLTITGLYDIDFTIYDGDYVTGGAGDFSIKMEGPSLALTIQPDIFPSWNRIAFADLEIDFNFDTLEIYGEDFTTNGDRFDWDDINSRLKPTFDAIWPGVKPRLEEVVINEINAILAGCKLFDMLNEVFDCFSFRGTSGLVQKALSCVVISEPSVCPL